MLCHFLLGAVADVVADVLPVAEAKGFAPLDQHELFVSAPITLEYRVRVLLNDAVVVPRLVVAGGQATREARHAEVVVGAHRTLNTYTVSAVAQAHIAMEQLGLVHLEYVFLFGGVDGVTAVGASLFFLAQTTTSCAHSLDGTRGKRLIYR